MESNAFTFGVAPGGLRSQNDIRILICYMVKSVPNALDVNMIYEILQINGLANYFEISDALSSLMTAGHILEDKAMLFYVSSTGEEIATALEYAVPISVREKALEAAFSLLRHAKIEKENKVSIKKIKNGYNVTCHISGGEFDLMKLCVYVPDLQQAHMVKRNFHRDPNSFYKLMLTSLTGDKDL